MDAPEAGAYLRWPWRRPDSGSRNADWPGWTKAAPLVADLWGMRARNSLLELVGPARRDEVDAIRWQIDQWVIGEETDQRGSPVYIALYGSLYGRKGLVIFDHPYNADSARRRSLSRLRCPVCKTTGRHPLGVAYFIAAEASDHAPPTN